VSVKSILWMFSVLLLTGCWTTRKAEEIVDMGAMSQSHLDGHTARTVDATVRDSRAFDAGLLDVDAVLRSDDGTLEVDMSTTERPDTAGGMAHDADVAPPSPDAGQTGLVRTAEGWRLFRHGQPYELRGVGGTHDMATLKALGGNSVRTWGISDGTQATLDEAHELGLTVTLGIWLGHREHGFDYLDVDAVAQQKARARESVLRYKDHPALLAWGVGNEVELNNDIPQVWTAIEEIAAMIKVLDPDTPTMIVTAELGEANAVKVRDLTPSIDIWGINVYDGISSLARRLDEAQWDRPYILTEYGPRGAWGVRQTPWGRPHEPLGVDKTAGYAATLRAMAADAERCLGGYAFTWSAPERPTDTWFSLYGLAPDPLNPAGRRIVPMTMIDALHQGWTGNAPDNRGPDATAFELSADQIQVGGQLTARMTAVDPESEDLIYWWLVVEDLLGSGIAWDTGATCERLVGEGPEIRFSAPSKPGQYRVFGFVADPGGKTSSVSYPFLVEGPVVGFVRLPFDVMTYFNPTGWMGDTGGLSLVDCHGSRPLCAGACVGLQWTPPEGGGWFGVRWQHPDNNWGDNPGLSIEPGARFIDFEAWSPQAGAAATFSVGSNGGDIFGETGRILLNEVPTAIRIELDQPAGGELTTGFAIGGNAGPGEPQVSIFVRNIRWSR
jgi:hypothetical protein